MCLTPGRNEGENKKKITTKFERRLKMSKGAVFSLEAQLLHIGGLTSWNSQGKGKNMGESGRLVRNKSEVRRGPSDENPCGQLIIFLKRQGEKGRTELSLNIEYVTAIGIDNPGGRKRRKN